MDSEHKVWVHMFWAVTAFMIVLVIGCVIGTCYSNYCRAFGTPKPDTIIQY